MSVHVGRSWTGTDIEDQCPCPKEPCGLVDPSRAVEQCEHHPVKRMKSMRQGHDSSRCQAREEVSQQMDENHSEEKEAHTVSVEPGDPHNDQMLAQTRDDLRGLLDVTIHPMIDQAEAQNADLASMMAALVNSWVSNNAYMPRERLASLAALLMFTMANGEREIIADGKTRRW